MVERPASVIGPSIALEQVNRSAGPARSAFGNKFLAICDEISEMSGSGGGFGAPCGNHGKRG